MQNTNTLDLAAKFLQSGNAPIAESIARAELDVGSDYEPWMMLLGMALQSQGRQHQAVEAYASLTRRFPKSATHWGNLGTMLRDAGRHEEAEAAYCQAIVLDPKSAGHYLNMGLLLSETRNYEGARIAFLNAVDLDADCVQARIQGASMCLLCSDRANADRLFSTYPDWPESADLTMYDRLDLARILMVFGRNDDAERTLARALTVATPQESLTIRARQASVCERLNRLDEARELLDLLPDPAALSDRDLANEIINVRASLAQRQGDLEGAGAMLENLAEGPQTDLGEASLKFSLAKVCDKQGDTDGAMRTLEQAHAALLRHAFTSRGFSIDPQIDPLISGHIPLTESAFANWPADWRSSRRVEPDPVFIVGFPRSGTTMLEQMLDAVPTLRSMDERQFLEELSQWMRQHDLSYPEDLGKLTAEQCDAMRLRYRNSVAKVVTLQPGDRLVDKNPLNMLMLSMIRRLFPDASIILALRHPCDVVLSCYMQQLDAPIFADICANLERLSTSYVNAMRFWIEHERLLEPQVLHLRYEDLLSDFDHYSRRVGEFLGIEDVSAMRGFHKHAQKKGFISTPSYQQVVQPLNSSAVGRWRRYENYFKDALPILRPMIEHWGYEA